MMAQQYHCRHCGSTDVTNDAIACWNVKTQAWEIAGLLDNNDCNDCGEEGCVENRAATPEEVAAGV
jgi:hypothetical protein